MSQAVEVATIIRNQIGLQALMILGAKHIAAVDEGEGALSFKVSGRTPKGKGNYIKITLTAMDDYTVEFGVVRKFDYTVTSKVEGVYADMLLDVIEEGTGLYASFSSRS